LSTSACSIFEVPCVDFAAYLFMALMIGLALWVLWVIWKSDRER